MSENGKPQFHVEMTHRRKSRRRKRKKVEPATCLLDLPDELILEILFHLRQDNTSFQALASTCHRIKNLRDLLVSSPRWDLQVQFHCYGRCCDADTKLYWSEILSTRYEASSLYLKDVGIPHRWYLDMATGFSNQNLSHITELVLESSVWQINDENLFGLIDKFDNLQNLTMRDAHLSFFGHKTKFIKKLTYFLQGYHRTWNPRLNIRFRQLVPQVLDLWVDSRRSFHFFWDDFKGYLLDNRDHIRSLILNDSQPWIVDYDFVLWALGNRQLDSMMITIKFADKSQEPPTQLAEGLDSLDRRGLDASRRLHLRRGALQDPSSRPKRTLSCCATQPFRLNKIRGPEVRYFEELPHGCAAK